MVPYEEASEDGQFRQMSTAHAARSGTSVAGAHVAMRELPQELATNLRTASEDLLTTFDELQMSDIARAAGVARSSLYYYFANKDDVLAFFLRAILDELAEATSLAAQIRGDAPTRLTAVVRAQLEHLNNHPAATQQLIAHLGDAGRLADIAARINEGFEEPVRRLLSEGAADGSLRSLVDVDVGATALFGAVLMIGLRSLILHGSIAIDDVMEVIGPMFWHGIAPESPSQLD